MIDRLQERIEEAMIRQLAAERLSIDRPYLPHSRFEYEQDVARRSEENMRLNSERWMEKKDQERFNWLISHLSPSPVEKSEPAALIYDTSRNSWVFCRSGVKIVFPGGQVTYSFTLAVDHPIPQDVGLRVAIDDAIETEEEHP